MRRALLLTFWLLGCAQAPVAERIDQDAALRSFEDYRNCVADAAGRLAQSASTAYEIADAAQASCAKNFSAMQRAFERHMTSIVATERGRAHALRMARQLADERRAVVRGLAVEYVVEQRR